MNLFHFSLQRPLTPANYNALVSLVTTDITTQLEKSVMKSSFNRVSSAAFGWTGFLARGLCPVVQIPIGSSPGLALNEIYRVHLGLVLVGL